SVTDRSSDAGPIAGLAGKPVETLWFPPVKGDKLEVPAGSCFLSRNQIFGESPQANGNSLSCRIRVVEFSRSSHRWSATPRQGLPFCLTPMISLWSLHDVGYQTPPAVSRFPDEMEIPSAHSKLRIGT